jgi:uncharacterized cupin superfamily protein
MRKINVQDVPDVVWNSPSGKFKNSGKEISVALGRVPGSNLKSESPPFDLELVTIPPGSTLCPYHSHNLQWELYVVISGTGQARHEGGFEPIGPGDAIIFPPGEAHTILNNGSVDLVYYVIANDPPGDSGYYPDSDKWLIRMPNKRILVKGREVDYFHGEDADK